jgi:hypothetical protein
MGLAKMGAIIQSASRKIAPQGVGIKASLPYFMQLLLY